MQPRVLPAQGAWRPRVRARGVVRGTAVSFPGQASRGPAASRGSGVRRRLPVSQRRTRARGEWEPAQDQGVSHERSRVSTGSVVTLSPESGPCSPHCEESEDGTRVCRWPRRWGRVSQRLRHLGHGRSRAAVSGGGPSQRRRVQWGVGGVPSPADGGGLLDSGRRGQRGCFCLASGQSASPEASGPLPVPLHLP